ncbi:MAG: tetratricopeptide repeat protein, partial [Candidatus Omnitrophota bacterium]
IGWCYYKMGDVNKALDLFEEYLAKYPQDYLSQDIRFWLGEHHAEKKDYRKAERYFNELLKARPVSDLADDAEYRLALITYEGGDLERAIRELERIKDDYPKSDILPTVDLKISELLMKKGDMKAAKKRLMEFRQIHRDTGFVKLASKYLGDIFREEKDLKEAIEYYKEAIDDRRGDFNAGMQFIVARLYEESGDIDSAISEYMKVWYIYPDSTDIVAEAQMACAGLFEKQGKWEDAEKIYKKIISMDVKEAPRARERMKAMESTRKN